MKAVLIRHHEEKQSLGTLLLFEKEKKVFECKTMELPWKNNQQNKSCIPIGTYKVRKHTSPKFGDCFHIPDVPERSEILIHRGNYNSDTHGCILPGESFADINRDGLRDVTSSKDTVEHLLSVCPDRFTLTIV